MAINDFAINEAIVNQRLDIGSGSGAFISIEQVVQRRQTGSGAIITIEQNVKSKADGAIITFQQVVEAP